MKGTFNSVHYAIGGVLSSSAIVFWGVGHIATFSSLRHFCRTE